MKNKHSIAIVGAGGIGKAVALILGELSDVAPDIYIGDAYAKAATSAAEWLRDGITMDDCNITPFEMPKHGINDEMRAAFEACEIVLDCLPGSQAPRIAQYAKDFNMHYANLTEYVRETELVEDLAKDADTGFVLQTGLAPGFINVLAHGLFEYFCEEHDVEAVDTIRMRVGALSEHAQAPHFYGFTWSPVGVATEYLKDAIVVRNSEITTVPSLSERETLIINGTAYEEDLTSGGAANLPQALAGRVRHMDYKTLRYPGHYAWVQQQLEAIKGDDKIDKLQSIMENEIPHLEDDVVVVYASVKGKDIHGVMRMHEKAYHIYPMMVGNHVLRAIQTTTAAPLAECARLLLEENLGSGVVYQSDLDPIAFLKGTYVAEFYGE